MNQRVISVKAVQTPGRILGQYGPHAAENCLLDRAIKLHAAHLDEKIKSEESKTTAAHLL